MKKLILIILLFIGFQAFSQGNCDIIYSDTIFYSDTIVCYGDSVYLSVVHSDTLKYLWKPTMDTTFNTWVKPVDTTWYYIEIFDTNNILQCNDSILIYLYPRLYIDTLIQMNMGCPGFCKGQMQAFVSGGFPDTLYHYNWYSLTVDPSDSSIVYGACDENYALTVSDGWGCKVDTNFDVKAYPIPEVEIIADDKTYIQNPEVEFSFNNISYNENPVDSLEIITWTWNFGDSTHSELANPVHVFQYVGTNTVWLIFNTYFGCVDSVSHVVNIEEAEITVPNVFTPNGDGINDVFEIEINGSSEKFINDFYISSSLVIMDRWGRQMYESNNYQNEWKGEGCPDGVYFFILKCNGRFKDDKFAGSVTILTVGE